MTSSTAYARPDRGFVDALAGPDGTADPAPVLVRSERYADPLAAAMVDPGRPRPAAGVAAVAALAVPAPRAAAASAAPPAQPAPSPVRRSSAPAPQRSAGAGRSARQQVPGTVVAAAPPAMGFQGAAPFVPAFHAPAGAYATIPAPVPSSAVVPAAAPQYAVGPYQHVRQGGHVQPAGAPRSGRAGPPPARRPVPYPAAKPKKKSGAGGFLTLLVFILIALFASGAGRSILQAIFGP